MSGGLEREHLFSKLYDDIIRRWEAGEFDETEMERRLDRLEGKSLKQLAAMARRKRAKVVEIRRI